MDRGIFITCTIVGLLSLLATRKSDSMGYWQNPGAYYGKIFGLFFPKGVAFNNKKVRIIDTVALCLYALVLVYGIIAPYPPMLAAIILCSIFVIKDILILIFCREQQVSTKMP